MYGHDIIGLPTVDESDPASLPDRADQGILQILVHGSICREFCGDQADAFRRLDVFP